MKKCHICLGQQKDDRKTTKGLPRVGGFFRSVISLFHWEWNISFGNKPVVQSIIFPLLLPDGYSVFQRTQ